MATGALTRIAKQWCPPVLLSVARDVFARMGKSGRGELRGPYPDWQTAERASTTYASPVILDAVAAATTKLLKGEAAYERDSVVFPEVDWPWPLLAALGRQAACDGGELRVLDFGGSLGSTGLIARRFLDPRIQMRWHIVEQPHYVARAAELPFPDSLSFFTSIEAATASFAPNIVIVSGVLHYLPEPFRTLTRLSNLGADTLLIDRTPCTDGPEDIITVQHVPASIFPASYPSWLFARRRMMAAVSSRYREVARFGGGEQLTFHRRQIAHEGWLFERIDPSQGSR